MSVSCHSYCVTLSFYTLGCCSAAAGLEHRKLILYPWKQTYLSHFKQQLDFLGNVLIRFQMLDDKVTPLTCLIC